MVGQHLLEPVKYYESSAAQAHHKNIEEYLNALIVQSGVNEEENRATVKVYKEQLAIVNDLDKKISKYKTFRTLLIIAAIIGGIMVFSSFSKFSDSFFSGFLLLLLGGGLCFAGIYFTIKKINPIIKDNDALRQAEQQKANELLAQAQQQMAPLNALFDNRDALNLVEKTVPEIKFDLNYSKAQEDFFYNKYNFVDIIDGENSVVDTLSGKFCGNPFLFYRFKKHTMGTQSYEGSLHITWTETYRDGNGNLCTRTKSQTLYATVVKPKPYFNYSTALGFGCQAAPDLTFSRTSEHIETLSDKEIEKKIKKGEKQLRKQAEKALKNNGTFQEMANSEFDVLFGANDRDHEVQFRLMFTPLAQRNMVGLMRSHVGFGDDFNFIKHGKFNILQSDHAQNWNMNTTAANYYSHDIDEIRSRFFTFNNTFFKSVYFDFAPLMSIPAYMNEPVPSFDDPKEYHSNYTSYEHESLANAIGEQHFVHELSRTDAILKTNFVGKAGGKDAVNVTAYSYTTEDRVDFVPVRGGDGYYHNVPVPWIEYIPVEKTSQIVVESLGLSEKEFRDKPDALNGIQTPWGFAHGIIGHINQV